MASDAKAQRRVQRAQEDVRAANRAAHGLLTAHGADPEQWRRPCRDGVSPAETLHHLALTGARVLHELRLVAAQGALTRRRARTLGQSVALKLVLSTWRLPERLPVLPSTDPGGVLATPQEIGRAHVTWTAGFIALLQGHPPRFLDNVRWAHPRYGDMDPTEWARFLRIYFRHHELRLPVG